MEIHAHDRSGTLARASAILLFALIAVPTALAGQQVAGLVAEQGTLAPAGDAVVTLFRVVEDEDSELEPTGTAVTDETGAFSFTVPMPGRYRAQADYDGLSSPLSPILEVGAGSGVDDLVLMVPSPLLMLAASCDLDAAPGAVVVGTVRDLSSEVPVPSAWVTARWTRPGVSDELRAQTDTRGRFLLCGVETDGFVQFRGESLGHSGEWEEVEIRRPAVVFHDIDLQLSALGADGGQAISEFVIAEMAGTMGDLRGQLLDMDSGTPIQQAVVRIRGTGFQAVSDAEGRFSFTDLQPGRYILEVQHLGYSVQTSEVDVPDGRDVMLRLRLSQRAVELEGIEVTVRAAVEEAIRTTAFRREVVSGEALAVEEVRGATTADVLRTRFTGVQVRELYTVNGTVWCIQSNRRVERLEGGGGCENVQVILDGARVADGAQILRSLSVSEIESIEFLPPSQATIQYGMGGDVANGVVIVYTRGKGPYRSPLRDR